MRIVRHTGGQRKLSACCVLCQQSLGFFNICNLLCDMRHVLTRLHRTVQRADIPVDDADALPGKLEILFAPLGLFQSIG